MARREPVTIYFSETEKEEIESEADRADMTVSSYCRDLIEQQRVEEAQEELSERLGAEERIRETIRQELDAVDEGIGGLESDHGLMVEMLRGIELALGVGPEYDPEHDTVEPPEPVENANANANGDDDENGNGGSGSGRSLRDRIGIDGGQRENERRSGGE